MLRILTTKRKEKRKNKETQGNFGDDVYVYYIN